MSQENVEIVQAAYAYLDRREIDAALALSHPEIEWVDDPRVPGGRTRRGHTEVKRYFESLPRYWESVSHGARAIYRPRR
jgi:ketosteroid isomerase-like protein